MQEKRNDKMKVEIKAFESEMAYLLSCITAVLKFHHTQFLNIIDLFIDLLETLSSVTPPVSLTVTSLSHLHLGQWHHWLLIGYGELRRVKEG
jgi:hypothetical protein